MHELSLQLRYPKIQISNDLFDLDQINQPI